MVAKLVLSFDKSKQADEYIKLFYEFKNASFNIIKEEKLADNLHLKQKEYLQDNNSNPALAFKLEQPIKSLRIEIEKLKVVKESSLSELTKLKPNLIQMYDAAYETFIENKFNLITTLADLLAKNSLELKQQIKNEADLDYNARHPNDLSAKRIATSGNRLAASYYVNESLRKFNENKIVVIQQKIDVTSSPTTLDHLVENQIKTTLEKDKSETILQEDGTIYTYKQSNPTPLLGDGIKPFGVDNMKDFSKEAIKGAGFNKVLTTPTYTAPSPPNISTQVVEVTENIASITEVTTIFVPAVSPSVIIPTNRGTQLINTDLIDPRQEAIIVPVSRVVGVPAYMKKYSINGLFSNDLKESSQSDITTNRFKTNKELSIKNPNPQTIDELLALQTVDASNPHIYNQFTITGINKSFGEKVQIEEVFSSGLSVLAFGAKPKIWQISGTLINDVLSRWKSKFEEAFDNHLRISKLAKDNAYVRIVIPADLIAFNCYPLDLNVSTQITSEGLVPFTMPVLVTEWSHLPEIVAHKNFIDLVTVYNSLKKTNNSDGSKDITGNKYGTTTATNTVAQKDPKEVVKK